MMSDSSQSITSREMHESNKREAFDGMRAYHQSEIAHKKDAIEIIKAVLTTTILIFGGLISTVITGKVDSSVAFYAAVSIALLIGLAVSLVVWVTNKKIDEDNKRYRKYCEEYILERELIGLEGDLKKTGYVSAWIEPHDPEKTGFHHTKNILRVLGTIVFGVAMVGVVFVHFSGTASGDANNSDLSVSTIP